MAKRYRRRRKSAASSIIGDTVFIGSKLSWKGALILGVLSFIAFYFVVPEFLQAKLNDNANNSMYPMLEVLYGRRVHWFQWVGIACGLVGVFFSVRNYCYQSPAGYRERGIVALMARILGRNID